MKYEYDYASGHVCDQVSNAVDCLDTILFESIDYGNANTIEEYCRVIDEIAIYTQAAKRFIEEGKITSKDTEFEDIISFKKAQADFKKYNTEDEDEV